MLSLILNVTQLLLEISYGVRRFGIALTFAFVLLMQSTPACLFFAEVIYNYDRREERGLCPSYQGRRGFEGRGSTEVG